MTRKILAVIAGGTLAFVWSSVSWMVIPWHQPTMNTFENEDAMGAAIKTAAPAAGIYTYPGWTDDPESMEKKHAAGPYVFASVVPAGVGSEMGSMMGKGLLISIIGAGFLLVLMQYLAADASWKQRAKLAVIAAIFVSLVPALLNWNWWHFPSGFTLVAIFDGIIAWSLAGLVVARLTRSGSVKA